VNAQKLKIVYNLLQSSVKRTPCPVHVSLADKDIAYCATASVAII